MRQLWDWKASADLERRAQGLGVYAQMCGWTLARAHARSGDRIAIAAYLGAGAASTGTRRLLGSYADQNEADYEMFEAAVATEAEGADRTVSADANGG